MNYRVVVPVYNEAKHIREFLNRFPEQDRPFIVLVDDGSTDHTYAIVKNEFPNIAILRHEINLGKGKSLETGVLFAIKEHADIIVVMDGDLQHNPEDVQRFLMAFEQNSELAIVFGARKINKTMPFMAFAGNKLLTVVINLLFHYFLNDTQCGFRAFKAEFFDNLRWQSSEYAAETEMVINAAKSKLKYQEIMIDTIYLDNYKGTYFVDGIIILAKIVFWKFIKIIRWD